VGLSAVGGGNAVSSNLGRIVIFAQVCGVEQPRVAPETSRHERVDLVRAIYAAEDPVGDAGFVGWGRRGRSWSQAW
jgi:hypothetical protein